MATTQMFWLYLTTIRYYRVIRLRCHKKKRKRCIKESTLLPVNGTYTCSRDTTFVSQHINTQHDRHGGRGTIHTVHPARRSCATWRAAFPEWFVEWPRWSSVRCQLHSVVFVRTQVTWRTPTRKSLEASSPGNSQAMGWAHHGRTSDCCMCRLKTPATSVDPESWLAECLPPCSCHAFFRLCEAVRPFSKNILHHFTMSRREGTCW
jgi:hypothetical protein